MSSHEGPQVYAAVQGTLTTLIGGTDNSESVSDVSNSTKKIVTSLEVTHADFVLSTERRHEEVTVATARNTLTTPPRRALRRRNSGDRQSLQFQTPSSVLSRFSLVRRGERIRVGTNGSISRSEQYLTSEGLLVSNNNSMHSRRRSFLDTSAEAAAEEDNSSRSSGHKSLGIASVASTVKISNSQRPSRNRVLRSLQQAQSSTTTTTRHSKEGPQTSESATHAGSHQQYAAPKVWSKLKRLVRGTIKSPNEKGSPPPFHGTTTANGSSPQPSLYDCRSSAAAATVVVDHDVTDAAAAAPRERAQSEASVPTSYLPFKSRRVRSSDAQATIASGHVAATNSFDSSNGLATNLNHTNTSTAATTAAATGGTKRQQEMLDHSIRGRLDGADVLFLGGVPWTAATLGALMPAAWITATTAVVTDPAVTESSGNYTATTLTGAAPATWTPRQMVTEMLWSSSSATAGHDALPQVVLEGIYPGMDSRWTVRVEAPRRPAHTPSRSRATTTTTASSLSLEPGNIESSAADNINDGRDAVLPMNSATDSPKVTSDKFRKVLWGSNNTVPADVWDLDQEDGNPLQLVVTRCSIPIDVDDDSLLISTREHIVAVHDVVRKCLVKGRFDHALHWLETLRQCLDVKLDPDLRSITGATLHNMGLLHLWLETLDPSTIAVDLFQGAYDERKALLPSRHPDLVVSMHWQALASFACGLTDRSIATLEQTLDVVPARHIVRAKVLNNLGVACHGRGDAARALREWTSSLEIQQAWLDPLVRREITVYTAAVTLCNMGRVYLETAEFALAMSVLEEALLLLTTIFRTDHDMVVSCLTSLALAKAHSGQIPTALQILQGSLRSQSARFGALSPPCIETIGRSGLLYAAMGQYESAHKCLSTVQKWQLANLSRAHPAIERSARIIQGLEQAIRVGQASTVSAPRNMVWV
jgi:tetratricopeptide (TPR) repeat protein